MSSLTRAVIAGFGLPGREAANALERRGVRYSVVEFNPEVVERCARAGLDIIHGDVRDEEVLARAGVREAQLFACCVPIDEVVLQVVPIVRRMNPGIRIVARCTMTSNGMKAKLLGADEVIVAEQVVAAAFGRALAEDGAGG